MTFADDRTKQAWVSLKQAEHAQMTKALELARRTAWLDLPPNEQVRYMEWAYAALKAEDKERTN